MSTRQCRFKDAMYQQLARLGKAVSSPKRLELLELLCQGPRTVDAVAQQAGVSIANASQHLQVLRAARLVEAERKGLYVEYRLADDEVCRFFVPCAGSRNRDSLKSIGRRANTSLPAVGSTHRNVTKKNSFGE